MNGFAQLLSNTFCKFTTKTFSLKIDFFTSANLNDYCAGILTSIPVIISGNVSYDEWDVSNFDLIMKPDSQLDIES